MSYFNFDYFQFAFAFLSWRLGFLLITGLLLKWSLCYGLFGFRVSMRALGRGVFWWLYLSLGLALLLCWGMGSGEADFFGIAPSVGGREAFTWVLLTGAFVTLALTGIASILAMFTWELLVIVWHSVATVVRWAMQQYAVRRQSSL